MKAMMETRSWKPRSERSRSKLEYENGNRKLKSRLELGNRTKAQLGTGHRKLTSERGESEQEAKTRIRNPGWS